MNLDNLISKLKIAGVFLKDTAVSALQESVDEIVFDEKRNAKEQQRKKDIITVLMVLSELNVKKDDMYDLLYRYWQIDSRSEATEFIRIGCTVEYPFRQLRDYLLNNGYSYNEMRNFMENNRVREKLENNPELAKMPIEKLKSEMEK